MKHAVDGMPQCRHCSAKFTRFEALQKHLRNGCPKLITITEGDVRAAADSAVTPPEDEGPSGAGESKGTPPQASADSVAPKLQPAPAPATSLLPETVALYDEPDFRAQLLQSWCQTFAHERYKTSLRKYGVFCGQWLALKGPSVKQHMRLSHANQWCFKSDAESCCSSAGFTSSVPCHYCGQDFKAPRSHLKHCPVLFQAALAYQALLHDGGGGLEACGRPSGSGLGVGQAGHADGRPGGEPQLLPEGQKGVRRGGGARSGIDRRPRGGRAKGTQANGSGGTKSGGRAKKHPALAWMPPPSRSFGRSRRWPCGTRRSCHGSGWT